MGLDEVVLAEPRGFCAGVDRAIEIVERALTKFGAPIYVRHEIVHNTYVVNDLKAKGAIFIEDLAEVPPGATWATSSTSSTRWMPLDSCPIVPSTSGWPLWPIMMKS